LTYRNGKLLRLCHHRPCMLQIPKVCTGGDRPDRPSVPCHSNMLRHGRGHAHKSHDVFTVPGCPDCHHWLDYGKASRDEKQDAFMAALERWWLYAWDNELLEVA
jgi:hypothetical protein